MAEAPERAHVLIAKFGADTAERLADELRFMANQIDRKQLSTGCNGSPSGGAIYSYKIRPEQTHDAYFEQVEAWLSERKQDPSPQSKMTVTEDALMAACEVMDLAGFYSPPPETWDRAFKALVAAMPALQTDSQVVWTCHNNLANGYFGGAVADEVNDVVWDFAQQAWVNADIPLYAGPASQTNVVVITEAMEAVARREGYGSIIKTTGDHPSWIDPDEIVARHLPCGLSERKAKYVTTWHHDFRVRADHPHYHAPQTRERGQ